MKYTVYVNTSYDGLAIFTMDDVDSDCLYFTAWFDRVELNRLIALSRQSRFVEIENYVQGCESWEGNHKSMKKFSQFMDLNDIGNWKSIL